MVVYQLFLFLLLFHSTIALRCYSRNETHEEGKEDDIEQCDDNNVCTIYMDGELTMKGCTPFVFCRPKDFCCAEELCNAELSLQCVSGTFQFDPAKNKNISSISVPDSVEKCTNYCQRISMVSEFSRWPNNTIAGLKIEGEFGCAQNECLGSNTCYIDINGVEFCCCDTNKCNADFPTTAIEYVAPPSISCYTSQSVEDKKLCEQGQLCARNETFIGCASAEECMEKDYCCIQELCNDDLFEKRKATYCTTGIFTSVGAVLKAKGSELCPDSCSRNIIGDIVTFRCGDNGCLGKPDVCDGSFCCCISADCAAIDLYPLPPEFKAVIPVLTEIERNYAKGEPAVEEEDPLEGGDYEQVEVLDDGSGNARIYLLIITTYALL